MVLTQAIAQIVAMTVNQLGRQNTVAPPTTTTTNHRPPRVDERHFRNISTFSGTNWKDFAFQCKTATRNSSGIGYKMLTWAEQAVSEIDMTNFTELTDEESMQMSGDIFNILTTAVSGEPLQMMYNCDFNGEEAWRRLTKRYSPSTPLRAMQLMV